MAANSPLDDLKWLNDNPRLEELVERYPSLWEDASRELVNGAESGRTQVLNQSALRAKAVAEQWKRRIIKSRNSPKVVECAVRHVVRSRMIILALDRSYLASAAGRTTGKVRFNLFNGYIIQKLLFTRHLTRKPASLRWVNFWWPFLTQKKLLMPLVQDKGIYCFYSKELIAELTRLIAGRLCLEIAAGDGTLAGFLKDQGNRIIASDDQSWNYAIEYPENVENLSAKRALAKYEPQVVICSWPPPGNNFERHVFRSSSVELYIVVGSCHKVVSGNWDAYAQQEQFEWAIDEQLSALVIPPGGGNAVIVFRRR